MTRLRQTLVACLFLTMFVTGCQRQSSPPGQNSKKPNSITLPAGTKRPVD